MAAAALLAGCSTEGLAFHRDDRLHVVTPDDGATVSLPFTIEWTVDEPAAQYLVLFDRSPMRPGQSLLSLVPRDDPCRADPGCPTAAWLDDNQVYVTSGTRITVEHLFDRRTSPRAGDRHQVFVVLLDDDDRRVGDVAFRRELVVDREDER